MVNTYVSSINSMTGDPLTRYLTIDSQDIKVSGETGDNIKQKCDSIAGGMQRLLMTETETEGDYELQIQYGYPIQYTV